MIAMDGLRADFGGQMSYSVYPKRLLYKARRSLIFVCEVVRTAALELLRGRPSYPEVCHHGGINPYPV